MASEKPRCRVCRDLKRDFLPKSKDPESPWTILKAWVRNIMKHARNGCQACSLIRDAMIYFSRHSAESFSKLVGKGSVAYLSFGANNPLIVETYIYFPQPERVGEQETGYQRFSFEMFVEGAEPPDPL